MRLRGYGSAQLRLLTRREERTEATDVVARGVSCGRGGVEPPTFRVLATIT